MNEELERIPEMDELVNLLKRPKSLKPKKLKKTMVETLNVCGYAVKSFNHDLGESIEREAQAIEEGDTSSAYIDLDGMRKSTILPDYHRNAIQKVHKALGFYDSRYGNLDI